MDESMNVWMDEASMCQPTNQTKQSNPTKQPTWKHGGAAGEDDLLEEGLAQVHVRLHDAPHQALVHAWKRAPICMYVEHR
jgi:hypothetical protein